MSFCIIPPQEPMVEVSTQYLKKPLALFSVTRIAIPTTGKSCVCQSDLLYLACNFLLHISFYGQKILCYLFSFTQELFFAF